jgi:hypothetical protein
MIDDKRVRELCARVIRAEGDAFEEAVLELANALEARARTNIAENNKKEQSAG